MLPFATRVAKHFLSVFRECATFRALEVTFEPRKTTFIPKNQLHVSAVTD
jgi:hypothetical protein